MTDLIDRQDAIDALKICDNNEDGINCHKCPLRDERWDGAWQDDETCCYRKLMRDSAKLLEMSSAQPKTQKLLDDGTLIVHTDFDITKITRVNITQNNTHYGDLFYRDEE